MNHIAKGWKHEPIRHKFASHGIKTKREYSKKHKYRTLWDIRKHIEELQQLLELSGYNVDILRDNAKGLIMSVDNHEISIYPSVTTGKIGYVSAEVTLNTPMQPNLQDAAIGIAEREAFKRKLTAYVSERFDDGVKLRLESKHIHGATDAKEAIDKIISVIKVIDEIGEK